MTPDADLGHMVQVLRSERYYKASSTAQPALDNDCARQAAADATFLLAWSDHGPTQRCAGARHDRPQPATLHVRGVVRGVE